MKLRQARPDEVDVVLAVLADAAAWLRTRGVAQWPDRFATDWVMPAIEAGETWLAEIDGQIVGSIVMQWDDPLFWTGYPSDAGYLHRLAVRRHGDGLGARLLLWAEGHTAAEARRICVSTASRGTSRCARIIERAGYEHVGDVTVDEFTQARYEKRIGT